MALKQLGLVAIGLAAGFLVSSLLPIGKLHVPGSGEPGASMTSTASSDRMRADYGRQIADLRRQVESLQASRMQGPGASAVSAIDERARLLQGLRKVNLEDHKKDELNRLLAAGFTMDRIEWIRKRSEELAAEWIPVEDRIRQQNYPAAQFAEVLAHQMDKDIELRQELGDEEYAKYRQATGRGLGLTVGEAVAGGIGERAGIKPGDQIIAYGGVRIFNQGELAPLVEKYLKSGVSITVDVVRNGQTIRLSAEPGNLRIQSPIPVMPVAEIMRRQKLDAAVSR